MLTVICNAHHRQVISSDSNPHIIYSIIAVHPWAAFSCSFRNLAKPYCLFQLFQKFGVCQNGDVGMATEVGQVVVATDDVVNGNAFGH